MPEGLSGSMVWWWGADMHTNVHASDSSISVTFQVAMVDTTSEIGSGSSDYTGTFGIVTAT